MLFKILTALCACLALSTEAVVTKFRPDYNLNTDTKIFYKIHNISKTWSDAVATCKLEMAELALPLSAAQAEVLKYMMGSSETTWVGLHDKFSEGYFVTLKGISHTDIYTNWKEGEPQDADGNADCVMMDRTGAYSDVLCNERKKFICTKEQSTVQEQNACSTADPKYFLESTALRCYKLHSEAKTWDNAVKTCKHELADLVAIGSALETTLLVKNLKKIPKNTLRKNHFNKDIFWLGYSDRANKRGEFTTLTDKPLPAAIQWADGMPEGAKEDEHCVAMLRNGSFTLANCNNFALFFCEKMPSTEVFKVKGH